jgi:hypothetical protein
MVATRRAELENVTMCRGTEGGGSSVAPRHCLNRFAYRISLAYKAEGPASDRETGLDFAEHFAYRSLTLSPP